MIRLVRRAFAPTLFGSLALLPGAALVLFPRAARAQAPDATCEAVERTEAMRNEGHFRKARALLLECVNAQCDGDVRRGCATTLQKLDAETPSIVVRATEPAGNDLTEVSVSLGEDQLVTTLDGMAIPVDPGEHTFTFRRAGEPPVVETLTIARGEKFRPIDVVIGASPALEPAGPESAPPVAAAGSSERAVATGTLIGVGVVSLGGFAWLGARARSGENDLESCDPACSEGRVDSVEKRYVLANVSLGVSVLAFGAATWLLLTAPSDETTAEDHGLAIGADGRGAFASYRGRF
ncbi:MAG TPA: hypothetical protein VNN80_31615 [Polyangiaceae bacterium]|nr:hypothetical protein [Polyangiaceae bacterium]